MLSESDVRITSLSGEISVVVDSGVFEQNEAEIANNERVRITTDRTNNDPQADNAGRRIRSGQIDCKDI